MVLTYESGRQRMRRFFRKIGLCGLALTLQCLFGAQSFADTAGLNSFSLEERNNKETVVYRVGLFVPLPSQSFFGEQVALDKIRSWKEEAQSSDRGFREYLAKELFEKYRDKTYAGFVDHNGNLRIADGHHTYWALQKLSIKYGVPFEMKVEVKPEHVYVGLTKRDFAKKLKTDLSLLGLEEIVDPKNMPHSIDDLQNDPLRSISGMALKSMGIYSKHLIPYAQFYAGLLLVQNRSFNAYLKESGLLSKHGEAKESAATKRTVIKRAKRTMATELRVELQKMASTKEYRRKMRKKLRKFR